MTLIKKIMFSKILASIGFKVLKRIASKFYSAITNFVMERKLDEKSNKFAESGSEEDLRDFEDNINR